VLPRLVELARKEPSPVVRSQLACSAKRLPGPDCLAIVRELLTHKEDVDDPHIPLLLWWAIEDKATSDRALVLRLLDLPEAWRAPLMSKHIVERLARRYMAGGSDADLGTCARLIEAAPGPAEVDQLVRGMEKALDGRYLPKVPAPLEKHLAELWSKQPRSATTLRLALRLGSPPAYEEALRLAADAKTPVADRAGLIEIVGQMGKADCVPALLKLLGEGENTKVRLAALAALQPFGNKEIADTVLELYPKFPAELRPRAQGLLCNRPASALGLLQAVDTGKINAKEIALDQLQRVVMFNNKELTKLVEKHWGKLGGASSGEKISRMRAVANMLRNGQGKPANGKALFTKTCAVCHTLFGEGNKVGPDLTTVDRKNLDFLLSSIVDPSAFIRPEFVAYTVETKDGRVLTGLIVESSPKAVTLLDGKNEKTVVAKDNIESQSPSPISLMPEKLLDTLDEQEIRDLFSYLRSDGK
jgi:putative heme-binding domain-containing protein